MMLSRALSLATVTLLIGCCAAGAAQAQENLDAGKSPSQIFAGTCTACHKSARGLLKTVAPGSLSGFLRQHYTTSPEMAGVLSSYLISNGANDTRYGDKQKAGKEAKSDGKPPSATEQPDRAGRRRHPVSAAPQEAEPRQESEVPAANEPGRPRRNAKRQAPTAEAPEAGQPAAEGQVPAQAAGEHGADGRKLSAKRRRGKPGLEGAPKPAEPASEEAGTSGAPNEASREATKPESTSEAPKTEASRPDAGRGEGGNPAEASSPPQAVNAEPAKQTEAPALRPDPVPPVTPAAASTSSSAPAPATAPTAAASTAPAVPPSAPSLSATPTEATQGTSASAPPAPASK